MVRIWRVPVQEFDRQHLPGERAELYCIVGALEGKYKAFGHRPETLRFKNRLQQLYARQGNEAQEMHERGFKHSTPLPASNKLYTCKHEEYEKDHAERALMKRQTKHASVTNQQPVKQPSLQ